MKWSHYLRRFGLYAGPFVPLALGGLGMYWTTTKMQAFCGSVADTAQTFFNQNHTLPTLSVEGHIDSYNVAFDFNNITFIAPQVLKHLLDKISYEDCLYPSLGISLYFFLPLTFSIACIAYQCCKSRPQKQNQQRDYSISDSDNEEGFALHNATHGM